MQMSSLQSDSPDLQNREVPEPGCSSEGPLPLAPLTGGEAVAAGVALSSCSLARLSKSSSLAELRSTGHDGHTKGWGDTIMLGQTGP